MNLFKWINRRSKSIPLLVTLACHIYGNISNVQKVIQDLQTGVTTRFYLCAKHSPRWLQRGAAMRFAVQQKGDM